MLGLTIILYLVAVALIRMKIMAISADILEIARTCDDPFVPSDLRKQLQLCALGAQFHIVFWGAVWLVATIVEIALIAYLW